MDTDGVNLPHLTEDEVVAYLGHELRDHPLRRVEQHLAQCAQCRDEIVEAGDILSQPRRPRWRLMVPVAAAAAAIVLLIAWPVGPGTLPGDPQHRDTPGAVPLAPVPIAPVGSALILGEMVWSRVAQADRYRLTLYDDQGEVVWRATTTDTFVPLPDSVELQQSRPYLWKVEARVGWDVWQSSDLTQFELRDEGAAPDPGDRAEP